MGSRTYIVYITTNIFRSVLYIGVTSDLPRRIEQHRSGLADGFTSKYRVHHLLYHELFDDPYTAISREKQLKGWTRKKKEALIERSNPDWEDIGINFL